MCYCPGSIRLQSRSRLLHPYTWHWKRILLASRTYLSFWKEKVILISACPICIYVCVVAWCTTCSTRSINEIHAWLMMMLHWCIDVEYTFLDEQSIRCTIATIITPTEQHLHLHLYLYLHASAFSFLVYFAVVANIIENRTQNVLGFKKVNIFASHLLLDEQKALSPNGLKDAITFVSTIASMMNRDANCSH